MNHLYRERTQYLAFLFLYYQVYFQQQQQQQPNNKNKQTKKKQKRPKGESNILNKNPLKISTSCYLSVTPYVRTAKTVFKSPKLK